MTTIYSDNLITAFYYASINARFCPHKLIETLGVLYASTLLQGEQGFLLIEKALGVLLATVDVSPTPAVLWSTRYQQQPTSGTDTLPAGLDDQMLRFPPASMDLAFDDSIFDRVKEVWEKIVGPGAGDFLAFQDREVYDDDDE